MGIVRIATTRGERPQDSNGGDAIAAGPQGALYVVDARRVARVQRFGADGTYLGFARRSNGGRYAGRYRQSETLYVPPAAAGAHSFDWLARSASAARPRRGDYKVFAVAWDEAGLESPAARAAFSLRRL